MKVKDLLPLLSGRYTIEHSDIELSLTEEVKESEVKDVCSYAKYDREYDYLAYTVISI